MKKNTAGQHIVFQLIAVADGSDAPSGLTPVVNVSLDGGTSAPGSGGTTFKTAGQYQYIIAQAETDGDFATFQMVLAGYITQTINVFPIDVAEYKADVTNLDEAVSTRMPTSHLAATAGKLDAVALADVATDVTNGVTASGGTVDTVTEVTNPVATDVASQNASKATVSQLATQAELDKVPKLDTAQTWTNQAADTQTVTITQP